MYTLLYLKWISDNLLDSTLELLSILWQPGWEGSLGENGYLKYMSEPLCCSPEAITILLIGYTPIQSMEKGIATRSSILAWRIPWTEEPSGRRVAQSQT